MYFHEQKILYFVMLVSRNTVLFCSEQKCRSFVIHRAFVARGSVWFGAVGMRGIAGTLIFSLQISACIKEVWESDC